jgi:hypothetical protein
MTRDALVRWSLILGLWTTGFVMGWLLGALIP